MNVGDRVYYVGDRANTDSYGTVIAVHPGGDVDIEYVDERFIGDSKLSRRMPPSAFAPGPGRRFYLASEWQAEMARKLAALKASMGGA